MIKWSHGYPKRNRAKLMFLRWYSISIPRIHFLGLPKLLAPKGLYLILNNKEKQKHVVVFHELFTRMYSAKKSKEQD